MAAFELAVELHHVGIAASVAGWVIVALVVWSWRDTDGD
jgi:hypothetical protein